MRTVLILSALVLVILFTTCQSCRQSNQHQLLIYTPHGQDMLRDFVARYKQAHPEVDVQFLDLGSREVLERLRAERNRPQADLWWGAAHTTFQTAADENLLAPFRPSWADKVPDFARDQRDLWYGTYARSDRLQQRGCACRGRAQRLGRCARSKVA